jgi:ribosomal protein S18 acetylase RimI-like enzyme
VPDLPVLRPARPGEARLLAALHHDELADSFLAALGPGFLAVLYRRILFDQRSAAIVAESGHRVVGFVAGTDDTRRLYATFVRRDAVRAGVAAGPRLLLALPRVVETLAYPRRVGTQQVQLPAAELLSLAVSRDARRRGTGAALVRHLQQDLAARGVGALRVVVAADNEAAVAVYRACDFVPVGRTEVHRGRISEVMVWTSS